MTKPQYTTYIQRNWKIRELWFVANLAVEMRDLDRLEEAVKELRLLAEEDVQQRLAEEEGRPWPVE